MNNRKLEVVAIDIKQMIHKCPPPHTHTHPKYNSMLFRLHYANSQS